MDNTPTRANLSLDGVWRFQTDLDGALIPETMSDWCTIIIPYPCQDQSNGVDMAIVPDLSASVYANDLLQLPDVLSHCSPEMTTSEQITWGFEAYDLCRELPAPSASSGSILSSGEISFTAPNVVKATCLSSFGKG